MSKPFIISTNCTLLLAVLLVAPAVAQISEWRGERLEQMRQGLDRIVERTEARAREPRQESAKGLGVDELTLPGQRPLRRFLQAAWNVINIPVTATVMTTPAGWFNDVTEPDKYRRGQQLVEEWLSTTNQKKPSAGQPLASSGNPLHHCVAYLQAGRKFAEQNVQNCSFVLYKRERIAGQLQQQQQMLTRVRFVKDSSGVPQLSEVFIEYLAPASRAGRRIVYKAGENNDKMLVREGSGLARHLTLKLSPDSRFVKMESQYSILDTGPLSVVERLSRYLEDTIRVDPQGQVTDVRYYENSKVAGRSCFAVVINFRERREGLDRRRAIVFVDSKTYVPVYLASFDWPESPGGEPLLHEEFIYTDLQFNVDLDDSHFQLNAGIE